MKKNALNNCEVYCEDCGFRLGSTNDSVGMGTEHKPCPLCGSLSRQFNIRIEDNISICDDLSLMGSTTKDTGGKKIIYKGKFGTEVHKETKTLQNRERFFDFVKGTYYERIKNKFTGFFKEVNERIPNHIGYGSDKDRNKNKPQN